MNSTHEPRLFYDGSCSLCRREIDHLRDRLTNHFLLVDISDASFEQWQDVDRMAMLKKIHVWTGDNFLVGLDASLFYWDKVGWRMPVLILRTPGIRFIAGFAYNVWAKWRFSRRSQCSVCSN